MDNMETEKVLRPRREKLYFAAGDAVRVRHEIANRPDMIVKTVNKITMSGADNANRGTSVLQGVTCWWFDTQLRYVEQKFNTKDLEKRPIDA